MTPKTSAHIIKGMQKDTSKSKLSKEFVFDAKNIRITAREDNSLLSITNEKGNEHSDHLLGNYLGHCVLNNQIIIFSKKEDTDYITIYTNYNKNTNSFDTLECLYSGNLNFDLNNPIETLGVYEDELIQKVYWVDGLNQPRVINIKAADEIKSKWTDNSFNFIPELALQESVSVETISNSSLFAPGVIQYAFSYYNKYGQESNIFDVTPLCYIAHKERGASPEEVIKDISFKININNVDTNFDYIRIYSIHRTSLNATPTVKRIIDLPIEIPEPTTIVNRSTTVYEVGSVDKVRFKLKSDITLPPGFEDLITGKLLSEEYFNVPIIEESTRSSSNVYTFLNTKYSFYDLVVGDYNEDTKEFSNSTVISFDSLHFLYIERTYNYGDRVFHSYILDGEKTDNLLALKPNPTIFYYQETIQNSETVSIDYIDNGTLGETIDPTQLLYIGGEDIIAGTITQKDNTLFLGNIKLNRPSLKNTIKDNIKNTQSNISFGSRHKEVNYLEEEFNYNNNTVFINNESYYRAGEHYRLGIQFQYKDGRWSEPLFISDITQSLDNRPSYDDNENTLVLPSFSYSLPDNIKSEIQSLGFKKMRGVVVYPEEKDRKVLLQGMLCPTLYNSENREKNNPYSQSSWYLRPSLPYDVDFSSNEDASNVEKGAIVEFRHGQPLITGANRGSEIQNEVEYKIDQSILNLYSPDIEFNQGSSIATGSNIKMRIVGLINFTSNYGYIDIQTKSAALSANAKGVNTINVIDTTSENRSLVSGLFYEDKGPASAEYEGIRKYLIYPWHRSGSLNFDNTSLASSDDRMQSAILEKKKISNFKISKNNTWLKSNMIWEALGGNSQSSFANGISKIKEVNSNQVTLTKLEIFHKKENVNYFGNVDTLVINPDSYNFYTSGDSLDFNSTLEAISYKDDADPIKGNDPVRIKYKSAPHYVFSLLPNNNNPIILPTIQGANNQNNTASEVDLEIETPDYGIEIKYKSRNVPVDARVDELWLRTYEIYGHNAFPILKKTESGWALYEQTEENVGRAYFINTSQNKSIIEVYKYVAFNINGWQLDSTVNANYETIESDKNKIKQDSISINTNYPYLFISELYRDSSMLQNAFGGITEEAIKNNLWLPASQSVPINSDSIIYEYGDTRYQRYDCLKTYAFTPEDENQVIEIASFMCETRVNMLGRYDKNIGNLSNLNADPTNFNLFNPVYSQKDNFFNYRILDSDIYKLNNFPNSITWSKEKHLGEDVDTWTNITMANTLDLDGTKGKVNKLVTFNEQIFAFQDKGISNILFNSRVQIPVSDGVPIEITNGYKVEGSRYISTELGCQNKYSIQVTPSGIYFLDSESGGIYLLGGEGLTNLSTNKGFDIWTKEVAYDSTFKTFYDKNNKDIYFVTKDYCLGYSEKLGQFTSFYDYNGVDTMFNIDSNFFSIKAVTEIHPEDPLIWTHFIGNYNEIFGQKKSYSITYIENDEPLIDKVFTNIEYRADAFDSNNNYLADISFDTIEVWNEYQEGKEYLKYSKSRPSNLKKKFRMWRVNIPRDKAKKLDRMRNPWLFIKLSKENPSNEKMELHDMLVHYFQ